VIRTVLAALDGSTRAPGVFDAAMSVAVRFGSILHVMRAVTVPPEFPPAAAGAGADPLPRYLSNAALEDLRRVTADAADSTVRVAPPVIRVGEAWRAILEVSEELDVDLIVLGSHGYGTLDMILGTTAARVANIATRNVLVVHERVDRLKPSISSRPPYR
jgi:nucleotide-binding universal stress UspA family protein